MVYHVTATLQPDSFTVPAFGTAQHGISFVQPFRFEGGSLFGRVSRSTQQSIRELLRVRQGIPVYTAVYTSSAGTMAGHHTVTLFVPKLALAAAFLATVLSGHNPICSSALWPISSSTGLCAVQHTRSAQLSRSALCSTGPRGVFFLSSRCASAA